MQQTWTNNCCTNDSFHDVFMNTIIENFVRIFVVNEAATFEHLDYKLLAGFVSKYRGSNRKLDYHPTGHQSI